MLVDSHGVTSFNVVVRGPAVFAHCRVSHFKRTAFFAACRITLSQVFGGDKRLGVHFSHNTQPLLTDLNDISLLRKSVQSASTICCRLRSVTISIARLPVLS